jgi:cytochrome oxidase Cu insertion factor (SCO1/SenC/PrrC family)
MLRWLATAAIAALFALNVALPQTSLGRRGTEARARADVPGAAVAVGQPLPDLQLTTLAGEPLGTSDLRGHRVLLVFERSVDW